jgi:CheY-like chemotaxis protein
MPDEKKKILTIDDEPDERLFLSTFFEDHGYVTETAEDGEEGLEKVKANPPDLITLDVAMPKKSGIRFFREIKNDPELSKIPIVMITGVTGLGGNADEFQKFLSSRKGSPPPDGFVPKPVDQQKLLETIRKLLK